MNTSINSPMNTSIAERVVSIHSMITVSSLLNAIVNIHLYDQCNPDKCLLKEINLSFENSLTNQGCDGQG